MTHADVVLTVGTIAGNVTLAASLLFFLAAAFMVCCQALTKLRETKAANITEETAANIADQMTAAAYWLSETPDAYLAVLTAAKIIKNRKTLRGEQLRNCFVREKIKAAQTAPAAAVN